MRKMLYIDGSYGEGGGQILRSSLTLSLITGKSFEIRNIRARRPKPGLRPQHLTCVQAAQKISKAQVEGDQIGSLYLRFSPGKVAPGRYRFKVGTAGATSLVFQTIALPLAHAGGAKVWLEGGTHVPYAPCYHYLALVYAPILKALGYPFHLELIRYGFYPRGAGEIKANILPSEACPETLVLKGPFVPQRVAVFSIVSSGLARHILDRQARKAVEVLEAVGLKPEVYGQRPKSPSPGTVVFVCAEDGPKRAGFFSLGRKGKPAERVGLEAAQSLVSFMETKAAVDPFLTDQLLLPAAVRACTAYWESACLTRHFFTNLWVIKHFLPGVSIEVEGQEGGQGTVKIKGQGLDKRPTI